jgi:hypothetical protein
MQSPRPLGTLVALLLALPAAAAEFRFEGHLDDGGRPANGLYDLQLTAFPAEKAGATLAAPIVFERVPVSGGRFQLAFDLPAAADSAWVEVGVREPGAGAFSRIPTRIKAIAAPLIGQCWSTTGDTGANPATNFLGTTDTLPLVLRTANVRSLTLTPSLLQVAGRPVAINVVGGHPDNSVPNLVLGATIAGGGLAEDSDPQIIGEAPNRVLTDFGFVGGGYSNTAGFDNGTRASGFNSFVGGGSFNSAIGASSVVVGGFSNRAGGEPNPPPTSFGHGAFIGGGARNLAAGERSVIAGGLENTASGDHSAIVGGERNCAGGDHSFAGGHRGVIRPPDGMQPGTACSGFNSSGDANGHEGTFLWAGADGNNYISGGANQFLVRASGGAVFQRNIGNSARLPRGVFNVVAGDSGETQPASPNTNTLLSVESDAAAFISMLTPATANRGILFASPGQSTQGAITYVGSLNSLQFTANGQTTMSLTNGVLSISGLGAAGSTSLCRNANNQISSCSSSARYKEQIADLGLGLTEVLRLRPVGYVWKDGGMADVGFVAEEIAQIDERLVTRNDKGEVEGVKYDRLTAVLAGAVQELAARESLQAETIARLQAEQSAADRRHARVEQELAELRSLVDGLRRERR